MAERKVNETYLGKFFQPQIFNWNYYTLWSKIMHIATMRNYESEYTL